MGPAFPTRISPMSAHLSPAYIPRDEVEQLREAREILRQEGQAVLDLAKRLDLTFCEAVERITRCTGTLIITGMGKAGLIGRKLAATFSSTGTPAQYLHPAEAVHGDLGSTGPQDLILALSNSGETEELVRLLPFFSLMQIPVIAITGRTKSTLARAAAVTLALGPLREAGEWALAPTTSTTAMLALGDALALVVSQGKRFTPEQFARFHPAGNLGRQLQTVGEVMRQKDQLRIAPQSHTVRDVFLTMRKPGRRTGAVMLVDDEDRLAGLFTDSDLARMFEARQDERLDRPICEVMTQKPRTITAEALLSQAVELLSQYRISELPVIDPEGRPIGLIDITDVIGLMPDWDGE